MQLTLDGIAPARSGSQAYLYPMTLAPRRGSLTVPSNT